jgi:hypothetical protein
MPPPDPFRVLGLPRDATQAEVKRAYRRLAKALHPDTAGEAATARFLQVQAAYEALVGGAGPSGRARTRPGPSPSREPWRADPERAREARESARSRSRPGQAGERPVGGRQAGERPAGDRPPRGSRAPNRATPGSTTYDDADQEPFDPDWSGASWYGTTSGTYWTINPREYADPRKHGPEYQARARRRRSVDGHGEPGPTTAEAAPDDGVMASAAPDPAATPVDDAVAGAAPRAGHGPSRHEAPGRTGSGTASSTRRPHYATRPPVWAPRPPETPDAGRSWSVTRIVDGARGTVSGRIGLALAGWLPIGIGLAVALGESTGCSRFVEGCEGPFGLATVIGQGSVVVLLLLLPRLAAIATLGTVAMFAAALPTVAALSIASGSRDPAGAAPVLGAVLALAWAVGIAIGIGRTIPRLAGGRQPPVP